ncbi:PAS domain-containing protein [Nannocystis sp. SCPEA4]|uniref:PAS domain-containing protein n=1 Tax=Nannocystis sp. SCPEA4 TaxID=2996787 RepID=UPI00226DC217|nr:PAS domain-containing protein [Nannocystis sp. SCPEA4]MCY1055864.1 PAS domain-containing protein [Nannocystis sp. SCPEA4]
MTQGPDLAGQLAQLQAMVDSLPWPIFWKDRDSRYLGGNQAMAKMSGFASPREMVGLVDTDMWWRDNAAEYRADDLEVIESGQPKLHVRLPFPGENGGTVWIERHRVPLRDASGAVVGVIGWFEDVTAKKQAEDAEAQAQLEATLEMATPLLPVADGVLVMPLIGKLDAQRAAQMTDTLLAGVALHRAHTAILDVTGVRRMDTTAIEALAKAAAGVRLLGAAAVVTGVGPVVAQAIVRLGVDLGQVTVLGDLKAGVAHALAQQRRG